MHVPRWAAPRRRSLPAVLTSPLLSRASPSTECQPGPLPWGFSHPTSDFSWCTAKIFCCIPGIAALRAAASCAEP